MSHAPSQDQTTGVHLVHGPVAPGQRHRPRLRAREFRAGYASGLTDGQPMMVPVPVLYGVPEDAAALVRYLRSRGISRSPGSRWARSPTDSSPSRRTTASSTARSPGDPARSTRPCRPGGPGLPDRRSRLDRVARRPGSPVVDRALRRRTSASAERWALFDFFSFEWYPFDDVCGTPPRRSRGTPRMLADILSRQETAGLPKKIPKVITEYGYSLLRHAEGGRTARRHPRRGVRGAVLRAGRGHHYFYGLEPNWVFREQEGRRCDSWGNLMLFQFFDDWQIRPVAAFYAMRLLTHEWAQPAAAGTRCSRPPATCGREEAERGHGVRRAPTRRPAVRAVAEQGSRTGASRCGW